jgi:hypothetical protein
MELNMSKLDYLVIKEVNHSRLCDVIAYNAEEREQGGIVIGDSLAEKVTRKKAFQIVKDFRAKNKIKALLFEFLHDFKQEGNDDL